MNKDYVNWLIDKMKLVPEKVVTPAFLAAVAERIQNGTADDMPKFKVFTANGTFTAPQAGDYEVTCVGGGGGGGSSVIAIGGAGGGGGSGYVVTQTVSLTLGQSVAVTVGAGGAGEETTKGYVQGHTGGTTSFGALVSAAGGTGGYRFNPQAPSTSSLNGVGQNNGGQGGNRTPLGAGNNTGENGAGTYGGRGGAENIKGSAYAVSTGSTGGTGGTGFGAGGGGTTYNTGNSGGGGGGGGYADKFVTPNGLAVKAEDGKNSNSYPGGTGAPGAVIVKWMGAPYAA